MCQDSQWDIPMASHKFFFKNTHFTTEMSQHQRKLQTNHLHTEQMQLTPFISHQLSFILLFVTKWEILTMKGEWGFTDRSVSAKLRKHAKLNRGIETYILLFVSFSLFRALPQTCLINNSLRKYYTWVKKVKAWKKNKRQRAKPVKRTGIQKQECSDAFILVAGPQLPWETRSSLISPSHSLTFHRTENPTPLMFSRQLQAYNSILNLSIFSSNNT